MTNAESSPDPGYGADERAAMRAFLQRSEVRLSTMHRVATALLSGAGILVILPVVARDAVEQVLSGLLTGPLSVTRALLTLVVASAMVLALWVLLMLIRELTQFYFHSNHVQHRDREVFSPRFTLTGLRLPTDELDDRSEEALDELRRQPVSLQLLVPDNERARRRIDEQVASYPGLADPQLEGTDEGRIAALFELAASRRRTLVDEVIKVEYGMVRHMLKLQVIILRYVKALLAIVVTAIAIFTAAAAASDLVPLSSSDERWIAGVMVLWAPVVSLAVLAPVQWLERLLRTEGAEHAAVRSDPELTRVERLTVQVALGVWLVAVATMVILLVDHDVSRLGLVASIGALLVSVTLTVVVVQRSRALFRTASMQ